MIVGRIVIHLILPRLLSFFVRVALFREQIDDAVEVGPLAHGDLHGNDLRGQARLDLAVDLLEAGVLFVHERDEKQPRNPPRLAVPPYLFPAHLYPPPTPQHAPPPPPSSAP